MRNLILHLWANNRREIIEKSRMNCHAVGVHSVMLLDAPEKRIRLFYAGQGHPLWRNSLSGMTNGLSVGFHAHHCALTLSCCLGKIENWRAFVGGEMSLKKFKFHSPLRGEPMKFEHMGMVYIHGAVPEVLFPGDTAIMRAECLHTVYVEAAQEAAWFVFEGTEDPNYQPFCYSNANLDTEDFSDLYRPAKENEVELILGKVVSKL